MSRRTITAPKQDASTHWEPYEILLRDVGNFTENDIQSLRDFIARSEGHGRFIDQQFKSYARFSPKTRGLRAEMDLMSIPRAGWVQRGACDAGNIYQHSMSLARFIEKYDDAEMPRDRRHLMKLAKLHDKAEALIGDFTPKTKMKYGLDDVFKKKLEAMAICIIYAEPGLKSERALIEEYEAKQTEAAQIVSDFDKCYAILEIMAIEIAQKKVSPETNPFQGMAREVLDEVLENHKVKTPLGLRLLDKIENAVKQMEQGNEEVPEIMKAFHASCAQARGR